MRENDSGLSSSTSRGPDSALRSTGPQSGEGPPFLALLGGSFNPPHVGHVRLALEVWEALRPERLLFIPAATPPHKAADGLLPFDLRARMLRAALDGLPGMEVCTLENERPGPSYTVDTLLSLTERFPGLRPAFIIGGEDLPLLPSWERWERLTELADLVVLPRGDADRARIARTVPALWPGCGAMAAPFAGEGSLSFALPGGGRILYLDRPRLEIRSSTLRKRWLRGDRLDFLLPKAVLRLLEENRALVGALWGKGRTGPA